MLILIKPIHFMAWVQVLLFVTFACFWVRVCSDTQASNSSSSCFLCPGFTSMCHHSFKHNAVKNICSWHVYVCTCGACHISLSSSSHFLSWLRAWTTCIPQFMKNQLHFHFSNWRERKLCESLFCLVITYVKNILFYIKMYYFHCYGKLRNFILWDSVLHFNE